MRNPLLILGGTRTTDGTRTVMC